MEEKNKKSVQNANRTPKKRGRGAFVCAVICVIAVIAMAIALVLALRQNDDLRNNPQQIVADQTNELRDKVGKILALPDEMPTLATVNNAETLKEQPFFKDVIDGDKVLIFSTAQKVVIYRESENKVINSGPINISSNVVQEE